MLAIFSPSNFVGIRGLPLIAYAPKGKGVFEVSYVYILIAYYMQKKEGQIACKNAGSMKKVTLILSFPYFWSDHKVRLYCT